jgi:hypothetical protein
MNVFKYFLLPALLVAVQVQSTAAQDRVDQDPPVRCLRLTSIQHISILDNSHIVFYMNGGKRYLNTLPYTCSGLKMSGTIMYRTSLSQLCDLDIITVLDSVGGEYRPGASCGLGSFKPITEQEIATLKDQLKKAKKK